MPFCVSCGNNISDLAVACPKCGTPNAQRPAGLVPGGTSLGDSYQNAPLLRPLSIGEVIDVAIKLYRSNFGTLLKLVAIVVAPVQLLGALIQSSAAPDAGTSLLTQVQPTIPGQIPATPTIDPGALFAVGAALFVTVILGLLATQLATAASLKAVSDAYLGEEPGVGSSLSFAMDRFGALLWLAVITGIGTIVGFMLCVIPGVYLTVAWAVAIPALLIENQRGTSALGRSRDLVRGRFWPVAGVLVLGRILASVLTFILVAGLTIAFRFGGDSEFIRFATSAIAGTIAQTLVTPFLAATIAILYFDLRVRKEGLDLELLARGVSATGPHVTSYQPPPPPAAPQGWSSAPPDSAGPVQPHAIPPAEPPPPKPKRVPRRPGWTPEDDQDTPDPSGEAPPG